MKKILLIMAMALLMLAVSGCSYSAPFGATPTPSARPTATPAATAPPAGTSFAGTWDTDFGKMVLTVDGDKATGTYEDNDGRINGTVADNKLSGTWTEAPTRKPPEDAGDFTFTLSADGSSFQGLWRYGHSGDPAKKYDGFWYGTRVS